MDSDKENAWREIVTALKEVRRDSGTEPMLQVYFCRACSSIYFHVGSTPQSECRICGRHALELQRELMEKADRRTRAMMQLEKGLDHFRRGNVAAAIRGVEAAIEADPDYNEAHYNLGEIYLQNREIEKGIASTRRALALEENDAMAHVNLGAGLSIQGNMKQALVAFNRALELNPDIAMARFNRGLLFLKMERLEEAMRDWQKYLELEPHSEQAATVRDIFRQLGL